MERASKKLWVKRKEPVEREKGMLWKAKEMFNGRWKGVAGRLF